LRLSAERKKVVMSVGPAIQAESLPALNAWGIATTR